MPIRGPVTVAGELCALTERSVASGASLATAAGAGGGQADSSTHGRSSSNPSTASYGPETVDWTKADFSSKSRTIRNVCTRRFSSQRQVRSGLSFSARGLAQPKRNRKANRWPSSLRCASKSIFPSEALLEAWTTARSNALRSMAASLIASTGRSPGTPPFAGVRSGSGSSVRLQADNRERPANTAGRYRGWTMHAVLTRSRERLRPQRVMTLARIRKTSISAG